MSSPSREGWERPSSEGSPAASRGPERTRSLGQPDPEDFFRSTAIEKVRWGHARILWKSEYRLLIVGCFTLSLKANSIIECYEVFKFDFDFIDVRIGGSGAKNVYAE
jgi:hypothetical protein